MLFLHHFLQVYFMINIPSKSKTFVLLLKGVIASLNSIISSYIQYEKNSFRCFYPSSPPKIAYSLSPFNPAIYYKIAWLVNLLGAWCQYWSQWGSYYENTPQIDFDISNFDWQC